MNAGTALFKAAILNPAGQEYEIILPYGQHLAGVIDIEGGLLRIDGWTVKLDSVQGWRKIA